MPPGNTKSNKPTMARPILPCQSICHPPDRSDRGGTGRATSETTGWADPGGLRLLFIGRFSLLKTGTRRCLSPRTIYAAWPVQRLTLKSSWQPLQVPLSLPSWLPTTAASPPAATLAIRWLHGTKSVAPAHFFLVGPDIGLGGFLPSPCLVGTRRARHAGIGDGLDGVNCLDDFFLVEVAAFDVHLDAPMFQTMKP